MISLSPYLPVVPTRKARKDVTLSNGVFIPQGTTISFPAYAIEHDERNYEKPNVFEPFRFVDLQDKSDDPSKYHLTSLSNDFLAFGMGKLAWYVWLSRLRACGFVSDVFLIVRAGL